MGQPGISTEQLQAVQQEVIQLRQQLEEAKLKMSQGAGSSGSSSHGDDAREQTDQGLGSRGSGLGAGPAAAAAAGASGAAGGLSSSAAASRKQRGEGQVSRLLAGTADGAACRGCSSALPACLGSASAHR